MADPGFLKQKPGFSTIAIHAGQDPEKWKSRAVAPPIVTSSTFKQPAPAEPYEYEYGRTGNPTRNALEECLAALDEGRHAITFSSGLGAETTIFALLSKGDHLICGDDIYGSTNMLLRNVISRNGIDIVFVDCTKILEVDKAVKGNTKMVWIETPTNPTLKVIDIAAVSNIVKKHGQEILVVVDNTFSTPYLQKPLHFGADIVMYSLTKYMNGHSDVVMGAAIVRDDDLARRLRSLQNTMGVVPSPIDCYLVMRSLKTLALRMERHKKSSLIIAEWLRKYPKVMKVIHPGLPDHPQHYISKKQTSGHSGVISFTHTGGLAESKKILSCLHIFTLAESVGGYESLAALPSLMTQASIPPKQRLDLGITDAFIRLSIGLEDPEDLIKDLEHALNITFCPTAQGLGLCSCFSDPKCDNANVTKNQ